MNDSDVEVGGREEGVEAAQQQVCVICDSQGKQRKTSRATEEKNTIEKVAIDSFSLPAPVLCPEHETLVAQRLATLSDELGTDYGTVMSALFLAGIRTKKFTYDDATTSMRALQHAFGPIRVQLSKPRTNATQDLKRFCRKHYKNNPTNCTSKPPPNQAAKEEFVRWARNNNVDLSSFAVNNRAQNPNPPEGSDDEEEHLQRQLQRLQESQRPSSVPSLTPMPSATSFMLGYSHMTQPHSSASTSQLNHSLYPHMSPLNPMNLHLASLNTMNFGMNDSAFTPMNSITSANQVTLHAGRMIPPIPSLLNSNATISMTPFALANSDAEASTAEALAALGAHHPSSVKL